MSTVVNVGWTCGLRIVVSMLLVRSEERRVGKECS